MVSYINLLTEKMNIDEDEYFLPSAIFASALLSNDLKIGFNVKVKARGSENSEIHLF